MENGIRKENKFDSELFEEAVKRMKMLKIYEPAIELFKTEGRLMASEPPFGALYDLNEEQLRIARQFEKEYDAMVYMAVIAHTTIGEMISYLFVSKDKSEWEFDIDDIEGNVVFAYTYNVDDPDCSESGLIGFESRGGGIIRTC